MVAAINATPNALKARIARFPIWRLHLRQQIALSRPAATRLPGLAAARIAHGSEEWLARWFSELAHEAIDIGCVDLNVHVVGDEAARYAGKQSGSVRRTNTNGKPVDSAFDDAIRATPRVSISRQTDRSAACRQGRF